MSFISNPSYKEIRQLYRPLQPTIKKSDESVLYNEFLPHPNLQALIYCYWQLKTTTLLQNPFNYRVVADGCIDIFFEANDPSLSFVMGFCKQYTSFELRESFHYVGIRFLPTMFPQLFRINAAELSNRTEWLKEVLPNVAQFIERALPTPFSPQKLKSIFDTYFLSLAAEMQFDNDPRLYEAIAIILKQLGVLNIEQDLKTGISPRQLRRLFKFYIGDTAKTFSKVVRFQNILKAKPSTQSLKQSKLFYDTGFYDQSHFIKDFKHFYGVTPTEAYR